MIRTRPFFLSAVLLFLLLIFWTGDLYCSAQPNGIQEQINTSTEKKEPDKIVGAPQDAKQKTAIWVFFFWMWISITVLIFFLRLKIKEVDRLYALRFFSPHKN